jgi:glutamate dehydrogenase (NAD(P)+)
MEGAIHNPNGLHEAEVLAHRRASGSILNFPGAQNIARSADALELDCDVLVPAALESQITVENAPRVRAKIILEGANGPTTPEAEAILNARGVLVIPDVYANAGGVTVSYFEWLKNLAHIRFGRIDRRHEQAAGRRMLRAIETLTGREFSEEQRAAFVPGLDELTLVNSGLEETMIYAYNEIREERKKHNVDLRTAAFISSINKVAKSYLEMGIFP